MLRKIDKAINWNFIYDLVMDKYCHDNGRPSLDPVLLIKLVFIQYLYGIKSMRQTIEEIEVNVAYRWFLGLAIRIYRASWHQHDSRTFIDIYNKILKFHPKKLGVDSGYRTPAIARRTIEDGIEPIMPYKRPQTKEGFFKKYEYVYDEYYDCYICPENKILSYSTTNREGYREYKSNCNDCKNCPSRYQCTESKEFVKVVTRHVWEHYIEMCEDIRYTIGNKEIYDLRKETIERIFESAKEYHGFRYTQYIGKARMNMKAGLTFACLNLKKLAKIMAIREEKNHLTEHFLRFLSFVSENFIRKEKWCWN